MATNSNLHMQVEPPGRLRALLSVQIKPICRVPVKQHGGYPNSSRHAIIEDYSFLVIFHLAWTLAQAPESGLTTNPLYLLLATRTFVWCVLLLCLLRTSTSMRRGWVDAIPTLITTISYSTIRS